MSRAGRREPRAARHDVVYVHSPDGYLVEDTIDRDCYTDEPVANVAGILAEVQAGGHPSVVTARPMAPAP